VFNDPRHGARKTPLCGVEVTELERPRANGSIVWTG
jgi:hypothetical protein